MDKDIIKCIPIEKVNNIYENIAEIAFQYGQLYQKGKVDISDTSSGELRDEIIALAYEFEDKVWKYKKEGGDYLGEIDNFIQREVINITTIKDLMAEHGSLLSYFDYRKKNISEILEYIGYELADRNIEYQYSDIKDYYNCKIKQI